MNTWRTIASSVGLVVFGFCGWHLIQQGSEGPFSKSPGPMVRLEVPRELEGEREPQASILATYEKTFRCTVYYTPKEAAITREGGFDVTEETRSGLQSRRYPRDFLKAVELEGHGRLAEPVEGKAYLQYSGKSWAFVEQPLDNHDRPLVAKQSCAIAQPHELVMPNALFSIRCPGLPSGFSNIRWRVSDTGGGLKPRQIDLYWGEDEPAGPGRKLSRPKGFVGELLSPTITVLADAR